MSAILVGYKLIQQQIIDTLKSDANLAEPGQVRKYYYGQPENLERFPLIWVEQQSGPIESSSVKKYRHILRYFIVVLDQHGRTDVAEKNVQDFAERIMAKLDDDLTLNGKVDTSYFVNAEFDRIRNEKNDYTIAGFRITMEAIKVV